MKIFFLFLFVFLTNQLSAKEIVVTNFYKYPVGVQYAQKLAGSELLTFEIRNNELTINNPNKQSGKILIIKEDGSSEVVNIVGITKEKSTQLKNRLSSISKRRKRYNQVRIAGYGTNESQNNRTKYTQIITARNELAPNTYLTSTVKYETFNEKKPSYYNIFYDSKYFDFEYGYLSYLGLNGLIGYGVAFNFNDYNRMNLLRGKYTDDTWIDEFKYNYNNQFLLTVDHNERNKNTIPVVNAYYSNDYLRNNIIYSYFKDVDGRDSNNLSLNVEWVKKNKYLKGLRYKKEFIESGSLSIYNDRITKTQVNTDEVTAQFELYRRLKGKSEFILTNNYNYQYDEINNTDKYSSGLGISFDYDRKLVTSFGIAFDSEKNVVYSLNMTALVNENNTITMNSNLNDRYSLYSFGHVFNKGNFNNVLSLSRNKYDQMLNYTVGDYLSYYIGAKNKVTMKALLGFRGKDSVILSNGQLGLGYSYVSRKYSIGVSDTISFYRRLGSNLNNNIIAFNYAYNFDFGKESIVSKQVKKYDMKFDFYLDSNFNDSQDINENIVNPADMKLTLINVETKEQFNGTLSTNQLFINSIPEGDYLVTVDAKYKVKLSNLSIDSSRSMTIPLYDSRKIKLNLYNENNKDMIEDVIGYTVVCDSGYTRTDSVMINSISEIEIPNEKCKLLDFDNINSKNSFRFISKELKIGSENTYNLKIFASNKLLIYLTFLGKSENISKNNLFSVDFNRKYIFNKSETMIDNIKGFNKRVNFSDLFKYDKKKFNCQFNDFIINFTVEEYKKYKTEIFCSLLKK